MCAIQRACMLVVTMTSRGRLLLARSIPHPLLLWSAQVPVVDLSQCDEDVLKTMERACRSTGFFYGAIEPPFGHQEKQSASIADDDGHACSRLSLDILMLFTASDGSDELLRTGCCTVYHDTLHQERIVNLSACDIVRNHGLDETMEQHFEMSKRFFQLPTDDKMETILDENAKCAVSACHLHEQHSEVTSQHAPASQQQRFNRHSGL